MNPEEFYKKYLGKQTNVDGAYGAQCWDLWAVFWDWAGIDKSKADRNTSPSGYARSIWEQRDAHKLYLFFDYITGASNFKDGDWVIWPKCSYAPLSHVAMYYKGKSFGQRQGGTWEAKLANANFSQAYGALRWKGWEKMELKEGYQVVSYLNQKIHVYKPTNDMKIGMVSAAGSPDYMAVQDITKIDADKLIYAKVNANYFEMSDRSIYGMHYGVEQSFQNDFAPKQHAWLYYAVQNDGTVVYGHADDYWLTKGDVQFACSPAVIYSKDGSLISTAAGDKRAISSTQTLLIHTSHTPNGFVLAVVPGSMMPNVCWDWAKSIGAIDMAVMDSGGSAQMVVNGYKKVYTGRYIPNVLCFYKELAAPPAETVDKDAEIKSLNERIDSLNSELEDLNNELSSMKTRVENAQKALKGE